ncbi:MAG TPA: hypothetical protein VFG47_15635 [Geminicoccaceae bacterium]|nr:hypothetical protein [Geminicoccaceae bacterium]
MAKQVLGRVVPRTGAGHGARAFRGRRPPRGADPTRNGHRRGQRLEPRRDRGAAPPPRPAERPHPGPGTRDGAALRRSPDEGGPGAGARGGNRLAGKRVLVVEDEVLLALQLSDALREEGCVVVGPVARLARALALIDDDEEIDGAVLDINLAGTFVFPLALRLRERGVPFVFATGYDGSVAYPAEIADAPRVRKPYSDAQIVAALERALGEPSGG